MAENLFRKNPLQDLLSSLNAVISTNESTRIITGHVIYNPAYTYKFQLKTIIKNWLWNSDFSMYFFDRSAFWASDNVVSLSWKLDIP